MGKSLILFRHAKAEWDSETGLDHDRPLAPVGEQAAAAAGRHLAELGDLPELVITSTALRAHTTLTLAAKAGNWPCPTNTDARLYDTNPQAMLHFINSLSRDHKFIMLVGHEPTWSELTALLSGEAMPGFPTSGMVRIDFVCDSWESVQPATGTVAWFIPSAPSPKIS